MPVLPAEIPTRLVTGQFYFVSADMADANTDPELERVTGFVRFTSTARVLRMPTKKSVLIPLEFDCKFNAQGQLVTLDDPTVGFKLPRTDSDQINPVDYTWRIDFYLNRASNNRPIQIDSFEFHVPAGEDALDLSTVMPVASSSGVQIIQGPQGEPGELLNKNVVLKTDPGVPTEGTTTTGSGIEYVEVTLDPTGRMLNGIKKDGTNHLPLVEVERLKLGQTVLSADMSPSVDELGAAGSGYQKVTIDPNGRIFEDALGEDGRVPNWVLAAWKARMGIVGDDSATTPMDIIVGAGQSNMGSTSDPIPADVPLPYIDRRIFMWTSGAGIQRVADVANLRSLTPRAILSFASEYVRTRLEPGRNVLIVNAGKGATGFSTTSITPAPEGYTYSANSGTWDRKLTADPENLYNLMVSWTQRALAAAPSGSALRVMLWSQGESDADKRTRAEYAVLIDDLITHYRADVSAPTLPVLVGSMVPEWQELYSGRRAIAAALETVPSRVERTAYVWGPANLGDWTNIIHWSAQGQWARGPLFGEALYRAEWNVSSTEPLPPQKISARRSGDVLLVEWQHPPCRFASFGLEYRVGAGAWTTAALPEPAGTSAELELGLAPNVPVTLRMKTTNSAGTVSATSREVKA